MFLQPATLDEALEMKARHGAAASFLAGGTDVIVMMNHGRLPAEVFIDLTHVAGLDTVEPTADRTGYRAGGGATFARLGRLPVRCLAEAALSVGGPQIRNRGTIAGNIASASPAGDGSTALLSLDAVLTLRSVRGERALPLRDFFLDYRRTALGPDEMITSVEFPADWRTAWHKLGKRGAMNISLVCCSVGVSPQGRACVAFGSVAPFPMRAPRVEALLDAAVARDGADVLARESLWDEAAAVAAEEVRPVDDFRGSAAYRRAMAGALLKKCLRQLATG